MLINGTPADDAPGSEAGPMTGVGRRRRSAFTLIEVVVAGAILALLAALTIPQVMGAIDKQRVQDAYDILQEVHYAFTNSDQTGFLNVVRTGTQATTTVAPGLLTELVTPVLSNTATMPNSCGGTFQTTVASLSWQAAGPFLKRAVDATGLATPIGTIQNTITRTLAIQGTWTQAVSLKLQIDSVDAKDAAALDLLVDGVANTTAGTVQYTVNSGIASVLYLIPVANRC